MRPLAALALPVLLSVAACAGPLTVVTFAVDGVSLLVSGKSISDHALSAANDEDCAMWRVFKDRPICREYEAPDAVLAAVPVVDEPTPSVDEPDEAEILVAEAATETTPETKDTYIETVSASRPQREAVALAANEANEDIVATSAEATPMEIAAIAALAPAAGKPKPKPRHFIVLGSYLKETYAKDALTRGRDFAPRMVRVRVRGKVYHRVVSGPYARDAISSVRKSLTGEGFRRSWSIKLCENSLRAGPCHATPVNVAAGASAS